MNNKLIYLIVVLFSNLFALLLEVEPQIGNINNLNRAKIVQFINNSNNLRSVIIEDFENVNLSLISHGEEDVDNDDWGISDFSPDSFSQYSLVLFGNTWKYQNLDSIQITTQSVWSLDMYSSLIGNNLNSEIQAIGIEDTFGNRIYYSIWGTQSLDLDFFENYYQGYFPLNDWTKIIIPLGIDWFDRFDYEPVINKLFYVNDADGWFADSIYFDNIFDISEDLPIPPQVSIQANSETTSELDEFGRLTQSYQFHSEIIDPDSEIEDMIYYWDFGDGTKDSTANPEHTYLIEDDHLYNVSLIVKDHSDLFGYALTSVEIDLGESSFPIKLNFVGDVMMGRRYNCTTAPTNDENCNDGIIPTCGAEYLFEYINPYFGDIADISIANLETPIIDFPNNPHPTKSIVFYSKSETISALEYSGIDVVSLANNHFLDYMVDGMIETQIHLDTVEIKYFGAGLNEYEAMAPVFINNSGVNIAIIGSSNIDGRENNEQPYLDSGYNKPGFYKMIENNINRQVENIDSVSDIIILETHSGTEYSMEPRFFYGEDELYNPFFTEPTRENIEFRHFAIDAGVDLLINHHPHVLQGIELYNGKLIAHSLGNFVFDQRYPETWQTIIINSEINENGFSRHWVQPVFIQNYIPKPATGKLAHRILDNLAYKSRKLNTYIHVDYVNEIAEVLFNPEEQISNIYYNITDSLQYNDYYNISKPIEFERVGSFKDLEFLNNEDFEFRLGREIIMMGDFEYNPPMDCWDPGINYWRMIPPETEFINDSISFNGEFALQQIRSDFDDNNAVTEISYCVPIENQFEHTVHGVVKGNNANNARINTYYYSDRNCGNSITNESLTGALYGDFDWTNFNRDIEVPENANFVDMIIRSAPPENGIANVYFDDLGIIQWDAWQNLDGIDSLLYPNDYYYIQVRSISQSTIDMKIEEIKYQTLPEPQPLFNIESNLICEGESVQLLNLSTGINLWWQWEVVDNQIQFEENPIFIFNNIGLYDVTLSIYGLDGELTSNTIENYIHVYSCYVGDINIDNEVNVLDVLLFVNLIIINEFNEIADLNIDFEINVLDILLLINIILDD
jgi:poly-gamma-glutamate capsule biosynthesis protein CapA/YwtB (metallophosphatase superfamily)/PKD repeat protein